MLLVHRRTSDLAVLISRFIWLPSVVEKLVTKHHVTPEEVEETFYNAPIVRFHEKGRIEGEHLYAALGQSDGGRYLAVFFILKQQRRALVISARDMTDTERKRYERRK